MDDQGCLAIDQGEEHDQCVSPIVEAARDRLRKSTSVVVRAVQCDYEHGTLVLRGRVPSAYCKQLAQDTLAGLPGVARVANRIKVGPAEA
jgi:osmotically-inducible protein OsmY